MINIPDYISIHLTSNESLLGKSEYIKNKISNLRGLQPQVTIVIPAYNEEESILKTLSSLSETKTDKSVEILVVDNNSTDRTKELVYEMGATYLFEGKQGVKNARNSGLLNAKGEYIINADADTIYSPYWVNMLIDPLMQNEKVACTYGTFSFIPEDGQKRFHFFLYELVGKVYKRVNALLKDEAIYVYGCSSAYRKHQALSVEGYEHPPGSNEDGYLGLKLRNKFGKLKRITHSRSVAWTSSRKFIKDGTLAKRVLKKLKINR